MCKAYIYSMLNQLHCIGFKRVNVIGIYVNGIDKKPSIDLLLRLNIMN